MLYYTTKYYYTDIDGIIIYIPIGNLNDQF